MSVQDQASALTYLKQHVKKDLIDVLAESEAEVHEFLIWLEHPVTKTMRGQFEKFKKKIEKRLVPCNWTEGEGKGMVFLLNFVNVWDEMEDFHRKAWERIQAKKQKEV